LITVRVLILSTTTGYQLRAFNDAAERLGYELAFATDRCHKLKDPWRDRAIAVRFSDEAPSVRAIVKAAAKAPIDGAIAVGDRPTVLASLAACALGLPGNPPDAARASSNKLLMRQAFARAGLPSPWFFDVDAATGREQAVARAQYPCVVKPLAMAASRGVMRADGPEDLAAAFRRVQALLARRDVQAQRNPAHGRMLVEGYIPGAEFAIEAVLDRGELHVLAIFEKPDPLVGPFFEETIYVTPPRIDPAAQALIGRAVAAACRAIGLIHGPVHAEVRVQRGRDEFSVSSPSTGGASRSVVHVIEVAARPIGGLCARALRFQQLAGRSANEIGLEELLLLHAAGSGVGSYQRERQAAGVMMIPVPRRGIFKRVDGLARARAIPGIEDIVITAKRDQHLVPLPEGSSYPGFIFARGETPEKVERALRLAHAALEWVVDRVIEVEQG
jgi:hypothetical protein